MFCAINDDSDEKYDKKYYNISYDMVNNLIECKYYTECEFKSVFQTFENSFSLLHFNSRSLNRNFSSLSEFIHSLSRNCTVYNNNNNNSLIVHSKFY